MTRAPGDNGHLADHQRWEEFIAAGEAPAASAAAAAASAAEAAASELAADSSADAAAASAVAAAASAAAASGHASTASGYVTSAGAHATTATNAAAAALASQNSATASAATATTKASEASASAAAALASQTAAGSSATTASTKASEASASAAAALASQTVADSSATTASTQAATATTQAGNAATSASAASTSASTATTKATEAATSARQAVDAAAVAVSKSSPLASQTQKIDSVVPPTGVLRPIPKTEPIAERLLRQSVLWLDANHQSAAWQKWKNLGTGGSALDAQLGSVAGGAIDVRPELGYVYLPGVANNYIAAKSIAAIAASSDKFVWVDVELPDWTPAASASRLIGTRGSSTAGFELMIRSGGTLEFQWRDSGTAAWRSLTSSALGFVDGTRHRIGASIDINNGSGGVTVRFWESLDLGATWTQIGSNATAATVAAIAVGTDDIEIGARGASIDMLIGEVYAAGIYDAIDVNGKPSGAHDFLMDCANARNFDPLFTATTGQTVTIFQSGSDSNDPKFLGYDGTPYVYLPGVASNFLSITSFAQPSADLDVRARWSFDSWTPAGIQTLWGDNAGDPTRCWRWWLTTSGTMSVTWYPLGTAASAVTVTSSAAVSATAGSPKWLRLTIDVNNGAGGYEVRFWTSDDGITYTQLGTTTTGGPTTTLTSSAIGWATNIVANNTGKFYRLQVMNGIDGAAALDIDTSVLTSGAATSFTATTGQTVTINRSTGGRQSVAVVAPVFLFGSDDYMEIADNDLLDFGATDSMSVLFVLRSWLTATSDSRLICKVDETATVGWQLRKSGTGPGTYLILNDGVDQNDPLTVGPAAGTLESIVAVVDRGASEASIYTNGVKYDPEPLALMGSVANAKAVRIGRRVDSTSYLDAEVFAVAVKRGVWTPSEIAAINTYYQNRGM